MKAHGWLLTWWTLCVLMWSLRAFRVKLLPPQSSLALRRHGRSLSFLEDDTATRRAPLVVQRCTFATLVDEEEEENKYKEFTRLAEEIRRHDALYYAGDASVELTDDEYDALVQSEVDYCEKYPQFLLRYQEESGLGIQATRFGGRVGALSSSSEERRSHLQPMLSLDNIHSENELEAWIQRVQSKLDENEKITILTEPKLDGLSLSLRYSSELNDASDEFKLQWAATRGDGTEGQDVTHAIRQSMKAIPKQLTVKKVSSPIEVRGEVIMPTTVFEKLQTNFSNARNAASGILLRKAKALNQEDVQLQSQLQFYAYDVISNEGIVENAVQTRSLLQEWQFQVPQPVRVTTLTMADNDTERNSTCLQPLLDYYHDLEQYRQDGKSKLQWGDYEMDGVVHKVSGMASRQVLGTTNRSPRWAVAHKFPPPTALTKLVGIEVQVGRTGALTPVALLEPVEIAGINVQRATLHNFGFCKTLFGSTSVANGTKVLVRRAGDVIPQVVQRVLEDDSNTTTTTDMISLEAPRHCPACGSPTKVETLAPRTKNATGIEGQVVRCGGPPLNCPPRAVGALAHAFSRDALDVTGLSEARIQQLLDAGLLKTPADIFQRASDQQPITTMNSTSNSTLVSQIAELPGWGEKSAQNLATAVRRIATRGVSLSRFIYSLGIRHAGQHTSKLLAATYGTADAFLSALENAKNDEEPAFEELVGTNETDAIKGIGPAQISSLRSFAREVESVKAARDLASAIPIHDDVSSTATTTREQPWQGYTVVFTGSLPMSRTKAQELARQLGAKATPSSVSRSTNIVVAGEKGGKKLDQALGLGVEVMDATEFVKFVEQYTS